MNIYQGPIAYWWFENSNSPLGKIDKVCIDRLVNYLDIAVETLSYERMFIPQKIEFFERWIQYPINENNRGQVYAETRKATSFIFERAFTLQEVLWDKVHINNDGNFMWPGIVTITGSTALYDSLGRELIVNGVLTVKAFLSESIVIEVETFSDAWLPKTLLCEQHNSDWRKNSDRLENALQKLEAKLGLELVQDDDERNDHAKIENYRLDNNRDVEGGCLVSRNIVKRIITGSDELKRN